MKNIMIISHSSGIDGPIDYYANFLLNNGYKIYKLEHPLNDYKGNKSILFDNKKILSYRIRKINSNIINLFVDFFISLIVATRFNYDTLIGANNYDTLIGIITKEVLRKKIKVIYFASDFSEDRYNSRILNEVYYLIEKISLKYADLVVSNTKRAENKRIELGLKKSRSIVIPNGIKLDINKVINKKIDESKFIFVGNVTKEHGLFEIIDIIKPIIKELVIIGQGNDLERIRNYAKHNRINLKVYYKKSHKWTINFLSKYNGFGLAPYNTQSKWTYYCSPLKVVEYVSCGLPVIISSVPEIADKIKEDNLGIVYNKVNGDILTKINQFSLFDFDKKSYQFYKRYNSDNLYKKINV